MRKSPKNRKRSTRKTKKRSTRKPKWNPNTYRDSLDDSCFLSKSNRKYPYCDSSGKLSCRGLQAAKRRAILVKGKKGKGVSLAKKVERKAKTMIVKYCSKGSSTSRIQGIDDETVDATLAFLDFRKDVVCKNLTTKKYTSTTGKYVGLSECKKLINILKKKILEGFQEYKNKSRKHRIK